MTDSYWLERFAKEDLLDVPLSTGLTAVLRLCSDAGFNPERVGREARAAVAALKTPHSDPASSARRMERQWYAALERGEPDWSIYDRDEYLGEVWGCWVTYSRRYLRAIRQTELLKGAKRIVDMGCGLGLTTAALSQIAPDAEVVGTQRPESRQFGVASRLGRHYGFSVAADVTEVRSADAVFASEYFEHFQAPLDHLAEVMELEPWCMIIANTFTQPAIGHFNRYVVDGREEDGTVTTKKFNDLVRSRGYEKVETGFWNNRPMVWRREET